MCLVLKVWMLSFEQQRHKIKVLHGVQFIFFTLFIFCVGKKISAVYLWAGEMSYECLGGGRYKDIFQYLYIYLLNPAYLILISRF